MSLTQTRSGGWDLSQRCVEHHRTARGRGHMGAEVFVDVQDRDADDAELERALLQLRAELTELDLDAIVPRPAGEAPPGAKSGAITAVGGLIVTITPTIEAIAALVGVIQGWLRRGGGGGTGRTVKLEIDGNVLELTGASSALQERLADVWIREHART